jgi:hypothetical protein
VSAQEVPDVGELTLLALAGTAREGTAATTVAALAETTRLPAPVVQYALRSLEASGKIARAGLRNGGPAYTILGP